MLKIFPLGGRIGGRKMDLMTDKLLSVEEIAELAHAHPNTVRRWIRKGIINNEQERIRLKTRKIGHRHYATPETYQRFVEQTSAEGKGED